MEKVSTEQKICPRELLEEKQGRIYRNIVKISYPSKITGTKRSANVVLPGDYSEEKKYPVLYCLHGYFGNENTMLVDENSKIPEVLGNMNDLSLAKEVITVFPNIYVNADSDLAPGFSVESIAPYDKIIDEIIDSIDPYIRGEFSILDGRENRGILGFSFGAREAIYMGLTHPEFVSAICAVAPAPGLTPAEDWAMKHPGLVTEDELKYLNSDIRLDTFIICRGSKDSVVGTAPVNYHNILERNEVEHIWYEVEEYEHGEPIVQSGLYNLMLRWK